MRDAQASVPPVVEIEDHRTLRKRAAAYIALNASEFAPFLPYEPGDGFGEDGDAAVAVTRYCRRLESSTGTVWGGHPEIRALSATLGVPIVVHQAGASPLVFSPAGSEQRRPATLTAGGVPLAADAALHLSFHRYYYALGEHYNSVVPISTADSDAAARMHADAGDAGDGWERR